MELIRVQCETCQTWLRVRGEGFLGEVHACPRCGSMVLIAATPNQPAETAPVEAAAPTTLAMSDTLETLEATEAPEPVAPETAAITAPVEEETLAESTAALSGWAPLATTAVALMATCALVGAWWVSGSRPQEVAASEVEPAVALPGEAEEAPPVEMEPVVEASTVEPAAEFEEPEPVVEPETEPVREAFELPPEPPVEAEPVETEPTPPTPEPMATIASGPDFSDAQPSVIDPLALDPNEIELILRRDEGAEPSPGDEAPGEEAPAVAEAPIETAPAPEPSLDERLAQAVAQAGVFVRRGPTDASTGPPSLSADKALTQVVPAIELRAIPLDEAVRLLSELSGAPITLDPAALRRAGVRPDKPIDLIAENQTLGQTLAAGLKQARLQYATDGAHIGVSRLGDDLTREITHRLADLAGDDSEALADKLARRLPYDVDLPINAAGQLKLTALGRVHFDLLVVCETLRVERGLPTTSKYPRALLTTEPYESSIASTLDRRTTFSFVSPTPLVEVFDHWRRVTERPILVDWPALAAVGVGPRTTLECSVTNRPWRAALDGVLAPLGLTWRADFAGSIWITAAAPGAATAGL